MTDFLQLAHDRYSCRDLSDKPVEAEKIDALVGAAVAAPTAVDKQPWHLWVVTDPDAVARLSACTRFSFGARVILMLGARADEAWVRKYDGRNFADVDASIVGTHIMLAAHDLGLGTVIMGVFDRKRLQAYLEIPQDQELMALIAVGHPAEVGPAPKRKDVDVLLSWL